MPKKKKIIIVPNMIGAEWLKSLENNLTALCDEYKIPYNVVMEQINACKEIEELNNILEDLSLLNYLPFDLILNFFSVNFLVIKISIYLTTRKRNHPLGQHKKYGFQMIIAKQEWTL